MLPEHHPQSALDCQGFEDRWNELLDAQCDPSRDSQLAEHAAACAQCRQLLRWTPALAPPVGTGTGSQLPELLTALTGSLPEEPAANVALRPRDARAGGNTRRATGVVAVLLLATVSLIGWYATQTGRRESSRREIAAQPTLRSAVAHGDLAVAAARHPDVQSVPAADASETLPSGQLALAVGESIPAEYQVALQDFAQRWSPQALEQLDTVEHMARPITASFSVILSPFGKPLRASKPPTPAKRQAAFPYAESSFAA